MYYEASIKYEKITDKGKNKKVTEKYLCEAICVSEVELRIAEKLRHHLNGEFSMTSVKETKILEAINPDSEKFYLVRYGLEDVDEKSGSAKILISEILIGANDFEEALEKFKKETASWVVDWELISISLSQIIEVI